MGGCNHVAHVNAHINMLTDGEHSGLDEYFVIIYFLLIGHSDVSVKI